MNRFVLCTYLLFAVITFSIPAGSYDLESLARIEPGVTKAENALWVENAIQKRFDGTKEVIIADIKGPAIITMIHFAMPERSVFVPQGDILTLGRDLMFRVYWDGETTPSIESPLVDFFCDPAGLREIVNTAMVNKCRGFNAYFPMPFRKSARLVLTYEGSKSPDWELWRMMPCYSYVMYKTMKKIPKDEGYFHAQWRQTAMKLGKEDYPALEVEGQGKFVGWNATVRRPGSGGYPVDMNEKFYVDGESVASVEFQGFEDAFGFSYGFPAKENLFPFTGWFPFLEGAAAYRFFLSDAISFQKSLRVAIGFGVNEHPSFRSTFSVFGMSLQFSSVCYWYQKEPHAAFPEMLSAEKRAPAPAKIFWPEEEVLPCEAEIRGRGVNLYMMCGRPEKEVLFADQGFGAVAAQGDCWAGWLLPVYHCRATNPVHNEVKIDLTVPPGAEGTLRMYILDPDNFGGGRRERISVGDLDLGEFSGFQQGKWIEVKITAGKSASGKLPIRVVNLNPASNAVISLIEWVGN